MGNRNVVILLVFLIIYKVAGDKQQLQDHQGAPWQLSGSSNNRDNVAGYKPGPRDDYHGPPREHLLREQLLKPTPVRQYPRQHSIAPDNHDSHRDYEQYERPNHHPQEPESYAHGPEQHMHHGPSNHPTEHDSYPHGPEADMPHGSDHGDCPRVKPADSVKKAYVAHTTFVWEEMAAQQAASGTTKSSAPKRFASGKKQHSSSKARVETSALGSNPDFLLGIGDTESGQGFEGTSDDLWVPTDEALAVGPHDSHPGLVTILHGVNKAVEIFTATKEGELLPPTPDIPPTKVSLAAITALVLGDTEGLFTGHPSAWFDAEEERYVIVWTSFSTEPQVTSLLFVAVSQTSEPQGLWTVWALDPLPKASQSQGWEFCPESAGTTAFSNDIPQASYSASSIFISVGAVCSDNHFLSTLSAYSKAALFEVPVIVPDNTTQPEIYAAMYFAPGSWYHSVPLTDRLDIDDRYKPFNNYILPVRPQTVSDMFRPPLFVMKVDNAFMSVATLTDEPMHLMRDVGSAPGIRAAVFYKGTDFSNEGATEGRPAMPQYGSSLTLSSGDTGMLDRTYGVQSYGAVQHDGLLYLTTSEFFGRGLQRIPSIYWAIVQPGGHLCEVHRKDWGVISSRDGLAVAFPVIAARQEGGALVAYSYSGDVQLPYDMGPAYPGVATTVVGTGYGYGDDEPRSTIDISKLGVAPITETKYPDDPEQPWGYYSAVQTCEGKMWFAVPFAGPQGKSWRSWVGVQEL